MKKITDKGIGNGTSLIITAGIIARLPQSLIQEFESKTGSGGGGLLIFLIEIALMVVIIMGIILLVQAVRKIPLNYARRIVGASSAKDISGNRDFIPIKVNGAGVMPIIFAQAMLFIPTAFSGFASESGKGILASLSNPGSLLVQYYICYSSNCIHLFIYCIDF